MRGFIKIVSIAVLISLSVLSLNSYAGGPKFKKGTVVINGVSLNVEIALTEEQQQYGLMNRTQLPENSGMLFIFDQEDYRSFWMKNTFVDLSIAYVGANKKILEIIDMEASKSSLDANPKTYPSSRKAKYALEVKQGWFKKNKIKVGDALQKINIK